MSKLFFFSSSLNIFTQRTSITLIKGKNFRESKKNVPTSAVRAHSQKTEPLTIRGSTEYDSSQWGPGSLGSSPKGSSCPVALERRRQFTSDSIIPSYPWEGSAACISRILCRPRNLPALSLNGTAQPNLSFLPFKNRS